jgi:polyketide cyclase/dehydrase/lipid transport protein
MARFGPRAFRLVALLVVALPARALAATPGDPVTITITDVPHTAIKQIIAERVVDAPAAAVLAVISDADRYAEFMPYVVESSVLARDVDSIVNYQRLAFGIPLVSPRHYAIRIRMESGSDDDGRAVYVLSWSVAAEAALPPRPSAVPVRLNNGFWYLQDLGRRPAATRVVYCLFTDPVGKLPAWIVNKANADAIPALLEAVRTAAQDERYLTRPSTVPPRAPKTLPAPTSCASDAR